MAEVKAVRKWTRFEFAPAIERIIEGARRALVTEVDEIREGDLIHVRPTAPAPRPLRDRDVYVRVTDRADRVLSIEVDDDRYRPCA